jgi:N-acetylneuraminate synthase
MFSKSITISGRSISSWTKPYVIAEISANHNGKIETALELIYQAKLCGADAVKLQTYRPDTITLNSKSDDFIIKGGLWQGKSLFELYTDAHMPWEWHPKLFEYAKSIDITIFSSPFDHSAIDFLESLNTPAYKIASFEAIDIPLIKYAAKTRKPLILSTGMANFEEITEAVNAAQESGCNQLALLHCVSGYPAPAADYNLRTIHDMKNKFNILVGLSDHTLNNITAITSVAFGACIIEKHFTLDKNGGGPDDSFSLEPNDLFNLCRDVNIAWSALGEVNYNKTSSELGNLQFRRSLYFIKNMRAGDLITPDSIRSVRPGFGLSPKYFFDIIGKSIKHDININSPVRWDDIE